MNTKMNKRSGFTLLEVIIVIIIIGVLASLALPRFFATVEFAKSSEALNAFVTLRDSIERCGTSVGGTNVDYERTTGSGIPCDFSAGGIDAEDPTNAPGAHFEYTITITGPQTYEILARRNALDGGNIGDEIKLEYDGLAAGGAQAITKTGTTAFSGI